MLNKFRKTKIIATIGESNNYKKYLNKLIKNGVDIIRLNFSHNSSKNYSLITKQIRKISKLTKKQIAIIGDLQGPKIRISNFKKNPIYLKPNTTFILNPEIDKNSGNKKQVGIKYKKLSENLIPGDILLLDDGLIKLKVLKLKKNIIFTKVLIGGFLYNKKGINKLGGGLSIKNLTKKDKKDILTASKIQVDYIAVSFPKNAKDIKYAKQLIRKSGSKAKIIAKIEQSEAIKTDKIIKKIFLASDAIMIARGDLSVEIGDENLITIQKKLIKKAKKLNKPVIIATQMMESMINKKIPTKAEVSDIANSVLDRTDAVMLSAETAIGKYPFQTVKTMSKICIGTEKNFSIKNIKYKINKKFLTTQQIIAIQSVYLSNYIKKTTAIISINNTYHIPLIMSRIPTNLPIFFLSENQFFLNLTALYIGIIPIFFKQKNKKKQIKKSIKMLYKKKYIKQNSYITIIQKNTIKTIKTKYYT